MFQIADAYACVLHYNLDAEKDNEGKNDAAIYTFAIEDPYDVSEKITGMERFFYGARPNTMHTQPIEKIIA